MVEVMVVEEVEVVMTKRSDGSLFVAGSSSSSSLLSASEEEEEESEKMALKRSMGGLLSSSSSSSLWSSVFFPWVNRTGEMVRARPLEAHLCTPCWSSTSALLLELGGVWAELCCRAALISSFRVSSFFCCSETSQRDFFPASEEERGRCERSCSAPCLQP